LFKLVYTLMIHFTS